MITGQVTSDIGTHANVAVSNGLDIVRTDADGKYSLNTPEADYPFVFVNLPAGWESEGSFFQRVNGGKVYDFRLRAAPHRNRDGIRITHVSDTHMGVPPNESFVTPDDLAADLRQVIGESQPDFVVITGDLTNLGKLEEIEAYHRVVEAIDTPIISLTAGHDYLEEIELARKEPRHELGARRTHQVLGVEQYSFDWGQYHFVLYPETHEDPNRALRLRRFLTNDLAMQPAGTPVIVITHDPPRAFPEKQPYDYGPSLNDIFQHPFVPLVMHGQYHIARVIRHRGAFVVGVTCLSMAPIDSHAPVYGVYELWDGRVTISLRSRIQFSTAEPQTRNAVQRFAAMLFAWRQTVSGSFHRATPVVRKSAERVSLIMPGSDLGNPAMYGIYAIAAANGATEWFTPTTEVVKNSLIAVEDDLIAVTVAGKVMRLRAESGDIVWECKLPTYPDRWIHVQPIVDSERIYVTNYAMRSCLDTQTGALVWHHHEDGLVDNAYSAPYQEPILHRGMIWQVNDRFVLCAIDAQSGDVAAYFDLNFTEENKAAKGERSRMYQGQIGSPIVCGDLIVAPGAADQIGVVDPERRELVWVKPVLEIEGKMSLAGDGRSTRPSEFTCGLAAGDGCFFATSASGDVFCINLVDGAAIWRTHLGDAGIADMVPYYRGRALLLTRPVVHENHVYVGGSDGKLYQLSVTNGSIESSVDLGSPVTAPLTIEADSVTAFCYNGSIWQFANAARG